MHTKCLASSLVAFCLSATAAAAATDFPKAPVTTNNNPTVQLKAELLDKSNSTIRGKLTAFALPHGIGVKVNARFTGLPDGEPLKYHIHVNPVPENGDCYATGGHLDPYKRTDTPPCDIDAPETCEVGDLSGKHGPIWAAKGEGFDTLYTDYFISTEVGSPAFFGGRSLVVHAADNSRLNCGNFEVQGGVIRGLGDFHEGDY
ncbi:putative cytosolic Cu/Zn superoxide dismutase [Aspergillus candidus]|uniref:superoxide dismutase n=1 Tax=Aspergillus candidus TaxID=41067 RepID=A0A2I2F4D8_ASPCN|nr:Cu,Zn superoxide dismutase-like protein [Aspergillus candidus]PLB35446.1 Cu,Zn superoxide dismutase-like protein [Aspergillus candidus]